MAKQDLENRLSDWDTKDELFRSYIDESNWPYSSLVFDPRVFTFIFEKTSRQFANKPRGRMVPREGGDALGAKINNELLSFQWDENERLESWPMLAKWAMMDQNTRKYGASFALAKWHWEKQVMADGEVKDGKKQYKSKVWFDGPDFKPLTNRDCLPNPSYSTLKKWFQYRDYLTLEELQNTNDAARAKPIYKNLDLLRQSIREKDFKGGDTRTSNYQSRNRGIKDLDDYLGKDEYNKVIEIVTEYQPTRWVTFAPKHGVVLRDIPNPYDHGQIPVVMLRYYPIDDDLYGLSEIEPIERLQKAVNALLCQYLDTINMSLYTPLKVRSVGVQMHTLEFGPGKKWIMNDPATDVLPFDQTPTGVQEFTSTYRFMIGAMQEALGETSAATSNLVPGEQGKTATEVKDLAISRNARDNFNQIFLAEAIKKQMLFWHLMNRQFLFNDPREQQKVIRIVGKDAIRYFQQVGLDKTSVSDETGELLSQPEIAALNLNPEEFAQPIYPVQRGGETLPKFNVEPTGEVGSLILEPEDLSGEYDYIPDIQSMSLPDDKQILAAKKAVLEIVANQPITNALAMDQYKIKAKELLEDYLEDLGLKDADKYFEKLPAQQPMMGGVNPNVQVGQPGAGGPQTGPANYGNVANRGMVGGPQAMAGGQAGPVVPRPFPVQAGGGI